MRILFLVLTAACVILPTHSLSAQVSRFVATWISDPSQGPGLIERLEIRRHEAGVRARVFEDCGDNNPQDCAYDVAVDLYTPAPGGRIDSTATAITFSYRTREWHRFAVLSWSRGLLVGDVFSSSTAAAATPSKYAVHQVLVRASYALPPSPPSPLTAMPQFPWPPPPATQRLQLPASLVTQGAGERLGPAFERIKAALARGAVNSWSVYAIADDGFAVVTRLEAITVDGAPKPGPDRWSGIDAATSRPTSFAEYLRSLFVAQPGHYRIIVLAVTGRPSFGGTGTLSPDSASKLVTQGADNLPGWLRAKQLPVDGRCIALIYEFRRASENDSLKTLATSPVAAERHLVLAGLWTEEAFR